MQKKSLSILLFICIAFSTTAGAQSADYDAEQEAAQRIKRQLELADEMRNERLKKQQEKERRQENEEKLEKQCQKLSEDLRRMNEHRRWYRLDDKGERVYLSEAEVQSKKQSLQNEYDKRCQES